MARRGKDNELAEANKKKGWPPAKGSKKPMGGKKKPGRK